MKKKFSSGLVIFAGLVSLPGAVSHHQTQPARAAPRVAPRTVSDPRYRGDPRLTCLYQFFGKSACPAREYAHVFLEAADDYHLDWRLLPSISFVESTGGKAAPNNNLFGWDCGRARFDSPAAGIHQVGFQLAHRPPYRHKNVDQILAIYNPSIEYAQRVKSVMRQIAPTE